ncbi:hypothetical protein FRC03_006956 [Tulasnella sp. 419]|nr:hypothetical protein FRC03_006956 [Tulasnella sp. 419]
MDFEHPVWDGKTVIEEEAVKAGLRLSRITVVLFLEDSFNPAFGFDIPNSTVTVVGTADSRFSFTAKADIGYSVAGVIALWAENPSAVPHTLHVASDTMTYGEVRDLLSKTYGREFKLVTEDADEYRKKALAEIPKPGEDILGNLLLYLRLLHANGVGDHSVNHNELINPGEKYWKWKKNAEYIEETKSA